MAAASSFENLTVIIPVINETESVRQGVRALLALCGDSLAEILFVVCDRTEPAALAACNVLAAEEPGRRRVVWQTHPRLGGAIRSGFEQATGSHVCVLYGDLEASPTTLPAMIEQARAQPGAVISASRWISGGGFDGYPRVKLGMNYLFQCLMRAMYAPALTDYTFGYRLYPVSLVRSYLWDETNHSFVLESLLKPLLDDVPVVEVATRWHARQEGPYVPWAAHYWDYLRVSLTLRLRK